MSYTVGFDFGTHQTKICIEDAANPAQKLYEFFEFRNNDKASVLFPSIVQINNDDTISYGFVDDNKCKTLFHENILLPELVLPEKPRILLPKEPQKPIYPTKPQKENSRNLTWKEQLLQLKNKNYNNAKQSISKWKVECDEIDRSYRELHNNWKLACNNLINENNTKISLWENKVKQLNLEYKSNLLLYEKKLKEKLQFRYFKLATFSNSVKWAHKIKPEIISVWYITYNLFLLQEKLGDEFYMQFGVPSGISENVYRKQKEKAFSILIASYKLLELYKTKNIFLKEKYTDLLQITDINYNYSDQDIHFYGLDIIPEAFAGLSSITQQKRLQNGMSLLVDIGGGTTDVVFFTITENDMPNIHSVISFPKGLNYIFESYIVQNTSLSINDVQELFFKEKGDKSIFNSSINDYHRQLNIEVKNITKSIENSFIERGDIHKLDVSKLRDALKKRPIIFCGGGSVYKTMRISVLGFTDKKLINKNLLNIPTILNDNIEEKLFTILATSYGLSVPLENEIKLTPIKKVFNHIVPAKKKKKERWDHGYEHGLTDY